jgi:hypothetical protein
VDAVGLDPRSRYVELFWLPVLGPSATWVLRRLVDHLASDPDGVDLDRRDAAREVGIGGPQSRHAPFDRALRRCARYGMVRLDEPGTVAVRRRVAPVPRHQLSRLPADLQRQHRLWERSAPETAELRHRAHLLAADLSVLDEDRGDVERRLLRSGVHPALAYEAAGWAVSFAGAPSAPSAPSAPAPVDP